MCKAFDSVDRGCLWEILSRYGCPPKFINIIRLFHDNMTATVRANGLRSDAFSVETRVKQGCVLAPTLFSLFLCAMLEVAQRKLKPVWAYYIALTEAFLTSVGCRRNPESIRPPWSSFNSPMTRQYVPTPKPKCSISSTCSPRPMSVWDFN